MGKVKTLQLMLQNFQNMSDHFGTLCMKGLMFGKLLTRNLWKIGAFVVFELMIFLNDIFK